MKLCRTCNVEKSKACFHKRAASKDGLAHKCKDCQKEYDKSRGMLPHRVEARKKYQATEAGKESIRKSKQKWIENNLIKRAANVLVGNAVRDGKLFKPECCSKCFSVERIHGHHCDYEYPLDVIWLCPACHKRWHDENGEGANA